MFKTYSFTDINLAIVCPGYPSFPINGQGVGKIGYDFANANTVHEVAADGVTMISKIVSNNGTLSITVQQTSELHDYFKGLFNTLYALPAAAWASIYMDLTKIQDISENAYFRGVSFEKRAGLSYESQGQNVTWNFMFAEGTQFGSTTALGNLAGVANVMGSIVNGNI